MKKNKTFFKSKKENRNQSFEFVNYDLSPNCDDDDENERKYSFRTNETDDNQLPLYSNESFEGLSNYF